MFLLADYWGPRYVLGGGVVGILECSDLGPTDVSFSCILQHRQVEFSAGNKQPKQGQAMDLVCTVILSFQSMHA